jgi:hypothetical protein
MTSVEFYLCITGTITALGTLFAMRQRHKTWKESRKQRKMNEKQLSEQGRNE